MNQHHLGTYDPVAAAAAAGYQQPHYQQQQQQQLQPLHAQGEVRQQQQPVVTSPTLRDVLNGRGQGVQRHPGNVKYRTLVFVNKVRAVGRAWWIRIILMLLVVVVELTRIVS